MDPTLQFLVREPTGEEDRLVDAVMAAHGQGAGDIHAALARLRSAGPVHQGDVVAELGGRSPLALRGNGFTNISVLGHDECAEVLREHTLFSSGALNDTLGRAYGRTILTMDPPEHRDFRGAVQPLFSKRALAEWSEGLFQQVVEAYVDRLLPKGGCDLYRELYLPFPVTILHRILGLSADAESFNRFHVLTLKMLLLRSSPEVAMKAAGELYDELIDLIGRRRAQTASGTAGDDLVATLVASLDKSGAMTDEELAWFFRILVPAGAETTSKAIGNLTVAALVDRSQWEALLADRALIPAAVEEGLRWDGTIAFVYRVAAADSEIAGMPVPEGSSVTVAVASANRDPRHFPDPNNFDVHRAPAGQLTFGHGIHLCLGHQMARMEIAVALKVLLERMPDLRLDPDFPVPTIDGLTLRAPTHLQVRWD